MNYPPEFIHELKARADHRCECERGECHGAPGRCLAPLVDLPDEPARWSPVPTGDQMTFPPVASNYIALCIPCVKPRVPPM